MKHFFLLATITTTTVKCLLPIFIVAVLRKTYFFVKIMYPISPNYNWENEVKQIKITEENLSQSCIMCQLPRANTLASGSKCIKQFFLNFCHYLRCICWMDVICLTCLVFVKSPWWLVWIFYAPTPSIYV